MNILTPLVLRAKYEQPLGRNWSIEYNCAIKLLLTKLVVSR